MNHFKSLDKIFCLVFFAKSYVVLLAFCIGSCVQKYSINIEDDVEHIIVQKVGIQEKLVIDDALRINEISTLLNESKFCVLKFKPRYKLILDKKEILIYKNYAKYEGRTYCLSSNVEDFWLFP
ncbi:MAG: hypothetical protein AAF849_02440 [Bacteroidota bacterium]